MIVPMKKVYVLTQSKDAQSLARKLRSLGVLHVENQVQPSGVDISSLKEDMATLDKTIEVLAAPDLSGKSGIKFARFLKDWRFIARHVIDTYARIDHLNEYSRRLESDIAELEPWGDFDPETLQQLADKNIYVALYRVPVKKLKELESGYIVKKISIVRGYVLCAVVSNKELKLPFQEIHTSRLGLNETKARLLDNELIISNLKSTLRKYTCYIDRFKQVRSSFSRELELHEAFRGMGSDSGLSFIMGFVPADTVKRLTDAAKKESWGIYITDPSEDDIVPTLVRNPKWISLIYPVFRLIEIVPGYKELDISLWFLIFMSVFFGMLIGDAGYGVAFLTITFLLQLKFGKRMSSRSLFYLLYILSSCAIIWGLLTGTVFGQGWLPQWVKPLVPALRSDRRVQELCFLIGALHLSIAHIWRAILKAPSVQALADIGWISILWGGFFLANMLVLGTQFPPMAIWLFIVGAVFVVLFTSPNKNIIKGAGNGLGALALNIVNSFTDIVSYIRLFAVGLATVAVADSFNKIAADIGFGTLAAGFIAAFILLIGHGLNIVMGPMSVLVHGVRLNVLEFCSHLDVKWSGRAYKPLSENSQV